MARRGCTTPETVDVAAIEAGRTRRKALRAPETVEEARTAPATAARRTTAPVIELVAVRLPKKTFPAGIRMIEPETVEVAEIPPKTSLRIVTVLPLIVEVAETTLPLRT